MRRPSVDARHCRGGVSWRFCREVLRWVCFTPRPCAIGGNRVSISREQRFAVRLDCTPVRTPQPRVCASAAEGRSVAAKWGCTEIRTAADDEHRSTEHIFVLDGKRELDHFVAIWGRHPTLAGGTRRSGHEPCLGRRRQRLAAHGREHPLGRSTTQLSAATTLGRPSPAFPP